MKRWYVLSTVLSKLTLAVYTARPGGNCQLETAGVKLYHKSSSRVYLVALLQLKL